MSLNNTIQRRILDGRRGLWTSRTLLSWLNTECDRNGRRGLWKRRCSACSRAGRWRWSTRCAPRTRRASTPRITPRAPTPNGLKPMTREEVAAIGGYNAFLATTLPPEHRIYDPDKETDDSSMSTFLTAFPRGFAIEVLDVYSGPPRVAFKFRHWGYMEGPFKGHPPHGRRVEFFGVCVFHVDEHTRVEKAEYF